MAVVRPFRTIIGGLVGLIMGAGKGRVRRDETGHRKHETAVGSVTEIVILDRNLNLFHYVIIHDSIERIHVFLGAHQ
jgi:hypothetical protein